MTEADFLQAHTVLTNEAEDTINSFYVDREISDFAAEHPEALSRMNVNPLFWTATAHAMQTTFVTTSGRLFDENPSSHSVHRLLKQAMAHPEYFSRDALRRRKLEVDPNFDPGDLDDYLAKAWEPTKADLEALKEAFEPTADEYKQTYKPIRHKLYAHKDVLDRAAIHALVGKGLLVDFEAILYATHDLLDCFLQLIHNGVEPRLGVREYGYEERIRSATRKTLEQLVGS